MDNSTGRSLEARARSVLDRVLELTVRENRFPREAVVRKQNADDRDVLALLLQEGRYLVRVTAGDEHGAWPPRLALTVLGIHASDAKEAQKEARGLVETRRRLLNAQEKYANRMVPLTWVHKRYAQDLERLPFRRWCTTLCSPRLQGRYPWDSTGFAGDADARGRVGKKTGFFTDLIVYPSFLEWDLPNRAQRGPLLVADAGLRVEDDGKDSSGSTQGWWSSRSSHVRSDRLRSPLWSRGPVRACTASISRCTPKGSDASSTARKRPGRVWSYSSISSTSSSTRRGATRRSSRGSPP